MRRLGALIVGSVLLMTVMATTADARWSATTGAFPTAARSTALQPPSALSVRTQCLLALALPRPSLTWQRSPSTFTSGYEIYRSASPGGPYVLRATVVGANTTSFVDAATLVGGQTYFYVVRATGGNWRSAPTPEASVTLPTLLCPLL